MKYTVCFIRCGEQLLLLNRNKQPNMGLWNGIGGKLEPGETPRECIAREVREESGVELPLERFYCGGTVVWEDEHHVGGMYLFSAQLERMEPGYPRETADGILAWKPLSWIMADGNAGIISNIPCFLPELLTGEQKREYRCRYREERLIHCEPLPLPAALRAI